MTKFPDLFASLAAPFTGHNEIKYRTQAGRQLAYVTARTVANRLDDVCGPENWWDEYQPLENSVICRLTLRLPDGSTVTKADAGGHAGMSDSGDDEKSGFSDAFKRAAVKWGIARMLYGDGVPTFVQERHGEIQESQASGPAAPERRPQPSNVQSNQERQETPQNGNQCHSRASYDGPDRPPTSGKALFAWIKKQEEQHGEGLLKYLNKWGKLKEFPLRMVDWDPESVALGHAEAVRKLQSLGKPDGDLPPQRDEDRPGQFPQNDSGYGRGQYASPIETGAYLANLNQFVEDRNQEWLDAWSLPDGTQPEGIGEYLRSFQITNHMLKWGLKLGRLADVGVAYDPETGKPVEDVPQPKADKYVAILAHRHREEFNAEVMRYARELADKARAAWMAKYGETNEAGSRG